jgi:hypothetical protein
MKYDENQEVLASRDESGENGPETWVDIKQMPNLREWAEKQIEEAIDNFYRYSTSAKSIYFSQELYDAICPDTSGKMLLSSGVIISYCVDRYAKQHLRIGDSEPKNTEQLEPDKPIPYRLAETENKKYLNSHVINKEQPSPRDEDHQDTRNYLTRKFHNIRLDALAHAYRPHYKNTAGEPYMGYPCSSRGPEPIDWPERHMPGPVKRDDR